MPRPYVPKADDKSDRQPHPPCEAEETLVIVS
jgi:hypothetical protein